MEPVTVLLTIGGLFEIVWGPEQTGHPLVNRAAINSAAVLAKVVDDLQLVLFYAPGGGDQHAPEWIQDSRNRLAGWAIGAMGS